MKSSLTTAIAVPTTLVLLLAVTGAFSPAGAQISIPSFGTPLTENFNSIAYTPDNNLFSALPAGWALSEGGTGGNTTYRTGSGTNTAGDTYSFGATGSTERAFGGLQSGTVIPTIGASFVNNTGSMIGRLVIEYVGEQWRLGATGRMDKLDFQYSLDASSLTSGTWFDVDVLDFIAPVTAGTVGALNGNDAANRTTISNTITGLSVLPAGTVWIRWMDYNPAGSDDGLGVDDFALTALEPPVPTSPITLGHLKEMYR